MLYRHESIESYYQLPYPSPLLLYCAIHRHRSIDPFQSAINIMGTCLFYFIGAGNIQQFPQGQQLLNAAMLERHTQEAIAFILAGVRAS